MKRWLETFKCSLILLIIYSKTQSEREKLFYLLVFLQEKQVGLLTQRREAALMGRAGDPAPASVVAHCGGLCVAFTKRKREMILEALKVLLKPTFSRKSQIYLTFWSQKRRFLNRLQHDSAKFKGSVFPAVQGQCQGLPTTAPKPWCCAISILCTGMPSVLWKLQNQRKVQSTHCGRSNVFLLFNDFF